MPEISIGQVDQAEAELREAKKAAKRSRATQAEREAYKDAANRLVEVRSAYRRQEEAAGRRRGLVSTEGE